MRKIFIKLLFIIILTGLLWALWPYVKKPAPTPAPDVRNSRDDNGTGGDSMRVVVIAHDYKNGTHSVTGTLDVPTPCHNLELNTVIAESYPEQVTLDFSIVSPPDDLFCTQVITPKEFSAQFEASPNPVMRAKVDGEEAVLITEDNAGTLEQILP